METYTLSEPQKQPSNPPGEPPPPSLFTKYKKVIIGGGLGIAFLLTFLLGMALSASTRPQQKITQQISPTPTLTVIRETPDPSAKPSEVSNTITYLPGKEYLDDSVAIITKSEPKKVILVSVARFEQEKNYTQYTKVNYYDGTKWARESITIAGPDSRIVTNPLLSSWTVRPGMTLPRGNDSSGIRISIENKPVSFTLSQLSADISTRALPGFTKFTYFGTGTITDGDEKAEAYLAYTQSYANSAIDVAYLNQPEKLESSWLVFWDTEGNAYQFDSLSSTQKSIIYENNISSVIYRQSGAAIKPESASIRKNTDTGQYSVTLSTNPQTNILFALQAPLEKSDAKAYRWISALTTGNIVVERKTTPGVGIFEVIEKTN